MKTNIYLIFTTLIKAQHLLFTFLFQNLHPDKRKERPKSTSTNIEIPLYCKSSVVQYVSTSMFKSENNGKKWQQQQQQKGEAIKKKEWVKGEEEPTKKHTRTHTKQTKKTSRNIQKSSLCNFEQVWCFVMKN